MANRENSAKILYMGHLSIGVDTSSCEDGNIDSLDEIEIQAQGEKDFTMNENVLSGPLAILIVERVQLSLERDPAKNFSLLTIMELAATHQAISTLQSEKRMLETGEVRTTDGLLIRSDFMDEYGQLVDLLQLHINRIVILRANKPEKAVIFIPADFVRQISNSECVGAVQLQQSGLQPVNEGGRGNGLVVIVLNGQSSSPLIACSNRALAIAVALAYQSFNSIIRAILINSIIAYGTQRIILFNQEFSLESNSYQNLSNLFSINMVKSSDIISSINRIDFIHLRIQLTHQANIQYSQKLFKMEIEFWYGIHIFLPFHSFLSHLCI